MDDGTVVVRRVRTRTLRLVRAAAPRVRCLVCGHDTAVLGEAQACALLRVPPDELAALRRAGAVHGVTTVNGVVWICAESLFERPAPTEVPP